jgi:heme/copper-type cytochrome/quinol oxidase subunit 2
VRSGQWAETLVLRTAHYALRTLAVLLAPAAFACPVCYGAGPGPGTDGLNNAIIFLLIIVGLVQAGFVALFWSFRKRAKALQQRREQFRVIEGGV